jgi:hypothetical protein
MNRIGTSAPVDPGPSLGWRFPLRRVTFRELGPLLHASVAPFRVAPLRLTGLFLLLWVPIVILTFTQVLGPFLSDVAGAVAFTAYTAALDAAGRSEQPDFRHLGVVLRFPRDKMLLLMLSGLLPLLVAVLVLSAVWGLTETGAFLDALGRATGHPSPVMSLDFQAAEDIASMPFTFVGPVWALYRWSGSRSMAANLLACLVNWRWVLALTGFTALMENLLVWLRDQGGDVALLSQLGVIVLQMLLLSWTLALAQRSFPAR